MSNTKTKDFKLEFSNRVIEHLGIKLYQNKPTNVVAEFVSNSWDADAEKVSIKLATEPSISITITDNGRGMTRDELTDEFLVIGRNRRGAPSDTTVGKRFLMGRKGIGKLAGFGIAHTVDILSVPNVKRRDTMDDSERKLYWLRFKLDGILAASMPTGESGYSPEVIADGLPLNEIDALLVAQSMQSNFKEFKVHIDAGEGGVCVYLHDTTLKKAINRDALLSSLAHRFTVTMLRPDFDVKVNDKQVDPKLALPTFLSYGVGSIDKPVVENIKIGDIEREVKFWVGFVSLKESEWPIEQAGVGVYAHGKIAQDRPFFFGVKGKEIFSRYIYGVVEADWLDELSDDVVSTDRRSVNWDDDATEALYKWGAGKLSSWLDGFRDWKKAQPREEIKKKIREIPEAKGLTGTEEDALAELLAEVFLVIGNDDEAKTNAISSITSAWTHEPTRKLTQSLWRDVLNDQSSNPNIFINLVEKLRESMVPEAMGLAVTMAQRIGAITALKKAIDAEKNETQLQHLIESFPWLLGPEWEKLTANQTIKTLVEDKYQPKDVNGVSDLTSKEKGLKPDFVFLSDVGCETEIIVVELKGPESLKTLQPSEFYQLRDYLDIISASYNNGIKIQGWIIGHETGGFTVTDTRITPYRWSEILASARKLHVSYLASLLQVSAPSADDQRIKQISDFGGAETLELLNRLGVLVDYDAEIKKHISIS